MTKGDTIVRRTTLAIAVAIAAVPLGARLAFAQSAYNGAPPADEKAAVSAPAAPGAVPVIDKPAVVKSTTATLSAGGQLATGNSNLLAGTINGTVDVRRGNNEYGAWVIGSYGQATPPGGSTPVETVGNFQVKLRYDRYVSDAAAVFLLLSGRNDRFQGLDFRFNVDPGFKYLYVKNPMTTAWFEAGYDFQYDARRSDSLGITAPTGAAGAMEPVPVAGCTPNDPNYAVDGNIFPPCAQATLPQTQAYHSARVFAGLRHAFSKDVTFSAGVEYLQAIAGVDSGADGNVYDSRLNFDAVFASKVGAGLSVGLGFHAAYDRFPLPGKQDLDTATTVTIIYSYSDVPPPAPAAPPPPPPAPKEAPPAPPPSAATPPPAPPPSPAAPSPAPPAPAPAPAAPPNP
jgi:hypothetical protein